MNAPSYLILGHVTRDIVDSSARYGGTASYAALTALNLGERAGLVTSAGEDFPFKEVLPGVSVACVPSRVTTVFRNVYSSGTRKQSVQAIASKIHAHNVPRAWRNAPIVHLAPIAQELDPRVARIFPHSLVGATAQGWLRTWDEKGQVRRAEWTEADHVLPFLNVLVISEDDVGMDLSTVRAFARQVSVVALTLGERGADVYFRGQVHRSPAFSVRVVDPTGAGDAFAAAFFVKLKQNGDPREAARYANCVASFVVEGIGLSSIPNREQVERRLAGV